MIAAMAQNRIIGKDNQLIWHFPDDLKRFKKLTSGHHVIMGRKTYESMNRPLPNRVNIVISRNADYEAEGCFTATSLESALELVKNDDQPFIIGGAEIYRLGLALAKTIELTLIHREYEGDTEFPEFDRNVWKLARGEKRDPDDKHPYVFEFMTYKRINL